MVRLAVVVSILSLSILCVSAGVASAEAASPAAQEAIPTAQGATLPDTSGEPPPPPLGTPKAVDIEPVQPGPCGLGPTPKLAPVGPDGEPQVDHSPHGEVYAGVGTHGYREVGGSVCVPVGKTGAVDISVDQTRFDGRRRW